MPTSKRNKKMTTKSSTIQDEVRAHIRDIPDFPKPGIIFKDITPVLSNGELFKDVILHLADRYRSEEISAIVGVDARGFIFSSALAAELGVGMVPIRKKGKLPSKTHSITYDLEYGQDTLEIHQDALEEGKKVILVDDVLATGGTIKACLDLLENISVEAIETAFLIELAFLNGKEKIKDTNHYSLVSYT